MTTRFFSHFLDAYLDAIVFTLDDDTPEDAQFSNQLIDKAKKDCRLFLNEDCALDLIPDNLVAQAGHDFWLTRNRHGTGFWSRPEIWEDNAQRLTELAQSFGECWTYTDEDTNEIHIS